MEGTITLRRDLDVTIGLQSETLQGLHGLKANTISLLLEGVTDEKNQ